MPFVGNTLHLAKLTSAKKGLQFLAFEELREKYNSDVIGLKLGRDYVVVLFGSEVLNETLAKDEFQGRPDNFFMRLRTMGKRLGKYEIMFFCYVIRSVLTGGGVD